MNANHQAKGAFSSPFIILILIIVHTDKMDNVSIYLLNHPNKLCKPFAGNKAHAYLFDYPYK
jgi:hypothetical protein